MDRPAPICNLDFETYSEAGLHFDPLALKWAGPSDAPSKGIKLVGAYPYAEHHSADILVACYSFDGGQTVKAWRPGEPAPEDLLGHVRAGGLVAAFNSFFEWCIWNLVGVRRYGWPALPLEQTRDTAAQALAWSLPGNLEGATAAFWGKTTKDKDGARIMRKLSAPRSATKTDKRLRFRRQTEKAKELAEWQALDEYCAQDVRAEAGLAAMLPPLSAEELETWIIDQRVNARGIGIDLELVAAASRIVAEGRERAGERLAELTGGAVDAVSKATALLAWVGPRLPKGAKLPNLREESVDELLDTWADRLDPTTREVVELRQAYGGSAPSKLAAMKYKAAGDGRVRGSLQYCGAARTRRWAGRGIQTQNFPNSGPELEFCSCCKRYQPAGLGPCRACGFHDLTPYEWGPEGVEAVIPAISTGSYDTVEALWGNPIKVVTGCLRAMLVAGEGRELVCADYSAIEAVVMACLAGEDWVIETFQTDGKLYERTAERVTGIPLKEILAHKEHVGTHHPKRKLGKVASLASQYQGALGAWLKFGAGKFLSDDEIRAGVKAWRAGAPNIVAFWYACERAAIQAVQCPGQVFEVGSSKVSYMMQGRALYCRLPSGGWLTYVDPEIRQKARISREGWNWIEATGGRQDQALQLFPEYSPALTYMNKGLTGWERQDTYGGKLAENIVQAVSRDLLAFALGTVEAAGLPIVMHTHDEIVAEVPEGQGDAPELERIMSILPPWAVLPDGTPWPVRAAGGWVSKRFRK